MEKGITPIAEFDRTMGPSMFCVLSGTGHTLSSMYKGYISLISDFTAWTCLKNGQLFQLDHNLFGRIPVDHTIQKTANKETLIEGG